MFTKIKNYLLIIMLAGMSLMALVFFIVALIYPTLPNVSHLQQYRPKEPLQIFSQEGLLIAEFGEERRDHVLIQNVPQKMINAILAIEDRRFFEHPGIDIVGVLREIGRASCRERV